MFSFNELEKIQIEITNRCQASCPMCLRNIHGGIDNPLLRFSDWSIHDFKRVLNAEVLSILKTVEFCGDFGDPILNNDLIKMCEYVRDNSNASVAISTNGSARKGSWWAKLAKALPEANRVEFALDGLSTTHHLYRTGTDFNNILQNAKHFMDAGGNAHWMFIKFKHNEHQVEEARNLASNLGFSSFTVKTSKRFGKKFPVLNRNGLIEYYIEQPSSSNIQPVEFVDLKDYKQWNSEVNCFALSTKELYIDAHGHLLPCCLIASFLYANYDTELHSKYGLVDETSIIPIAKQVQDNVYSLINQFGGLDALDSHLHGIKEIMNQPIWLELMHSKWAAGESDACTILCSKKSPYISIQDQINREV